MPDGYKNTQCLCFCFWQIQTGSLVCKSNKYPFVWKWGKHFLDLMLDFLLILDLIPCRLTWVTTMKGAPVATNCTYKTTEILYGPMVLLMFQPAQWPAVPLVRITITIFTYLQDQRVSWQIGEDLRAQSFQSVVFQIKNPEGIEVLKCPFLNFGDVILGQIKVPWKFQPE